MTTLYRTVQSSHQDLKKSSSAFGLKNLNIRHRNYSNSRLNAQRTIEEDAPKPLLQYKQQRNEQTRSTNGSKELKKYCIDKMRSTKGTEQFNAIRKNRSLKVIFKDNSNKQFNRTKVEPLSSQELFPDKREENAAVRESTEKGVLISVKRRMELLKKNQSKLKLNRDKQSQCSKDQARSDVSLGERLDFFLPEQEKVSNNKIQSENLLGQGLKKCSSAKIKILVKNPFERLMRLEESKQIKKQSIPVVQKN